MEYFQPGVPLSSGVRVPWDRGELAQGGECTNNSTEPSVVSLCQYEHMAVLVWESQPVYQGMAAIMAYFLGFALHHNQLWEGHKVRSSQFCWVLGGWPPCTSVSMSVKRTKQCPCFGGEWGIAPQGGSEWIDIRPLQRAWHREGLWQCSLSSSALETMSLSSVFPN